MSTNKLRRYVIQGLIIECHITPSQRFIITMHCDKRDIYIYKLQVYEVVTSQWKITSHSILQMVLGSICCLSNGGLITLWFKTIIDDLVVTMGSWDCIEAYCNMCIFLSVKFSAIFEQIWLGEYCSIVYLVKTIWKTFDALLISILGW
jgi:hypothetical protein